jgi:iron complex outermembrane recepter protein
MYLIFVASNNLDSSALTQALDTKTTFTMKASQFLTLLVALCFVSALQAQKIQGKINSSTGAAVEFASVVIYRATDSTLMKGTTTNATGVYQLTGIDAGSYFINAQQVGMGIGATSVFEYKGGDLNLEPIIMTDKTTELKGVVITAKKPIIEVKADRTIFNVEADANAGGKNALELLRKAPGVNVDNNDNVGLAGKSGIKFLIDGREVPMDNADVAKMLKTMRADEIAAFEMITNPSAKYDASGNAGIINIKTKKSLNLGTNGTVGFDFTQGETPKGGINLRLNNRNEKTNVFGSYNNHYGTWHNTLDMNRTQSGRIFDSESRMQDVNGNHTYKAGADFFLNKQNTVGVLFNGRIAQGPWSNSNITKISDAATPSRIDSMLVATNRQEQKRTNNSLNLNYRFEDTSGHVLTADLDRGFYRFRADSYQPNKYMNPAMTEVYSENNFATITPTDVDITTAKVDYEQNALKGKLGVGAKVSNVVTDNIFDFFNVVGGQNVKNLNLSNQFTYDERVSAAYVNYNTTIKKWGIQSGLRYEHSDIKGVLTAATPQQGETVDRTYGNLFPSASLSYAASQKHQYSVSYSRRIDRPSYRDLNPFEERLDELSYKKGNPFLRPQFSHNAGFTYTFMQFASASLNYSHTNDVFAEIIDTAQSNRTFLTPQNIANQDNLGLSLNVPLPIRPWWEGYLSVTVFRNQFEANFRPGFQYNVGYTSWNAYSEHNIKLPKGFTYTVSGWYNAPSIWGGVFRSKSQGAMDMAIKKDILKGNGELRLNVGDVLRTAGWRSVNDFTPGLYMLGKGTWESKTYNLTGTYRFGNKNVKSSRQRSTGLEDEAKRIKSGN